MRGAPWACMLSRVHAERVPVRTAQAANVFPMFFWRDTFAAARLDIGERLGQGSFDQAFAKFSRVKCDSALSNHWRGLAAAEK